MTDLAYSVGLDVTDLKTGARQAKEQVDDIKHGFKGFKDILALGGVTAAVIGFFSMAVDHAKEMKGAMTEGRAETLKFGETMATWKGKLLDLTVSITGWVSKMGQGLGMMAAALVYGKQAVIDADAEEQAAERRAEIEKAAAEQKKADLAEEAKLKDQIAAVDKARDDLALSTLTTQEKYNVALAQGRADRAALAAYQGDELGRTKLTLAARQSELEFLKAHVAVEKERDAAAKKTAEERKKAADDLEKKAQLDNAQQLELFRLQQKRTMDLTTEEKNRLAVLLLITQQKHIEAEMDVLLDKGVKNLTPEEKLRLAQLDQQNQKLLQQLAQKAELVNLAHTQQLAESKVTDQLEQQVEAKKNYMAIGTIGTSKQLSDLTDRELAAKRTNLSAEVSKWSSAAFQSGSSSASWYYKAFAQTSQKNLDAANAETYTRSSFRADYARRGEAALNATDPFQEQRFRNYIRTEDQKAVADQQNAITEIADRLAGRKPIFGQEASRK